MMRFWVALLTIPACAHVVSMSSGDFTIEGSRAHYELRMPLYEMVHVPDPERTLLQHIRFSSGGREASLLSSACQSDPARQLFVCTADYQFAAPVERLEVDCTFAAITVPTHVHLLRANLGDKHDQGLFDLSFTHAGLRFRPPTAVEVAATESGAGFVRALGGPVQILFLAALALASRTRKELVALAGMFLAGQLVSVLVVPQTAWQPAPRFVEAAAALTIAYLGVEILLLPEAGARWLVAGVLGIFHGLYLYLFIDTTGYHASAVLGGAAAAELAAIAIMAPLFARIGRLARALRPLQVSASGLLLFGMAWFIARLRG